MKPNFTPHTAQALIHAASKCRFRTVCTGRRFGKTLFLAAELLDRGAHDIAGTCGWVTPHLQGLTLMANTRRMQPSLDSARALPS